MLKIYCIVCDKYRKFKKPKISYIFKNACLFIVYRICGNEYKKYLIEKINWNIKKLLV